MAENEDEGFGLMFGMFDEAEPETTTESPPEEPAAPVPDREDTCPVPKDVEIKGRRVLYRDEDEGSLEAKLMAYEAATGTYAVTLQPSGMARYGVTPDRIDWNPPELEKKPEEEIRSEKPAEPQDELWLAARRGSLASVTRFIEVHQVSVHETGAEQQRSALYWAVFTGHVEVAEYLLNQGAVDADGTAFVSTTKPEMLDLLVNRGWSKTGAVTKPRKSVRKSVVERPPVVEAAVQEEEKKADNAAVEKQETVVPEAESKKEEVEEPKVEEKPKEEAMPKEEEKPKEEAKPKQEPTTLIVKPKRVPLFRRVFSTIYTRVFGSKRSKTVVTKARSPSSASHPRGAAA